MSILSYMNSFSDELEKIAMSRSDMSKISVVGAIIGGAAGLAAAPNTIKGKLIGTALGAGVGHGVGAVAKGGKRMLYDEPEAQNHAQLYSHVPYSTQQQAASPYGPYAI